MKNIKNFIKKHPYYTSGAVVAFVAVIGFIIFGGKNGTENTPEEATRKVETLNVSETAEGALSIAYPTASGNSFVVRAQAGGRVNSATSAGTKVEAGSIIAEIDNASERAALTQAQGSYEAALASAAQSDVGVADAETALVAAKQAAISADRAAMTAWNGVLLNTVDQLFSNPRISPGVRISASGQATELNQSRSELSTVLNDWQKDVAAISSNSDSPTILAALNRAISDVERLTRMVDIFISLIPRHEPNEVFSASDLSTLSSEFSTARATLDTHHAALLSAKSTLVRAEEAVNSAAIGGTGGAVSSANAAIKQALGSYQAAKAS